MADPRFSKWLAELPPELAREPNPYTAAEIRHSLQQAEQVCAAAFQAAAHGGFSPRMDHIGVATVMVRTLGIYLGAALQPNDATVKALAVTMTECLCAARSNQDAALLIAKAALDGLPRLKMQLDKQ